MEISCTDQLIIVSGGPGSGKTTLVEALAAAGLRTMPEAGRAIIRDQQTIGGTALPWADRAAFAELMLGWEIRSHGEALAGPGPVILDRGVPDVAGYLTLCGIKVPPHVRRAAELFRYRRQVFLAPPWRAIFTQDAERQQNFAEAEATFEVMARTYAALGYEPILLPLAPVAERAAFLLGRIG